MCLGTVDPTHLPTSNEDPMKIITESEAITNALKERQEDIDNGYDIDEWGTTHGNCQYCNIHVTYPLAWEQGGVVTIINHSIEATRPLKFWCPRHFIRIRIKSNIPLKSSKNLYKFFK